MSRIVKFGLVGHEVLFAIGSKRDGWHPFTLNGEGNFVRLTSFALNSVYDVETYIEEKYGVIFNDDGAVIKLTPKDLAIEAELKTALGSKRKKAASR